ncbi:hypothetical protein Pcinc_036708 [Petrolisthes cinctipes]|uniref:Uncharacterized protein n=1 Tax=Petrolisthes cinctipes TaxID=88211 RepID=A0AAE1BX58_PETCI|nr:hypothetical protein Pcinc_036708 [Petrolisthes cinctipes]
MSLRKYDEDENNIDIVECLPNCGNTVIYLVVYPTHPTLYTPSPCPPYNRLRVADEGYESDYSRRKFYPILCRIVQRWEVLQAQAVERQRHSGQIRELQRQVKSLRQALEALTERANQLTQAVDVDNHGQLARKLEDAKVR